MKLTAFQSDNGDCLLLESAGGKNRILVDGGMPDSYTEHVAPALGKLRAAGKRLDAVYISHIDRDHIAGVLQMLDDEAAWRVHEHLVRNGNPNHRAPASPRPPQVNRIWHNSFRDQVKDNKGRIENLLAATAEILSGSSLPLMQSVAAYRRELAAAIPDALRVSARIRPGQLNIPLNPEFGSRLMMIGNTQPELDIGSMKLRLIGPFKQDLDKLRKEWNAWLDENEAQVKRLRARAAADERRFADAEIDAAIGPLIGAADVLAARELALMKTLGRRSKVTTPNLASLMFLAIEGAESILLTGDGHSEDILKGLAHIGVLDAKDRFHATVLKVQHHGSEHNIDRGFCDRITADHYVFCGNGEHANPDLDVLETLLDSRMEGDKRTFRWVFNSSSKVATDAGAPHMVEVEKLTRKLVARSKGRLAAKFLTAGSSISVV